MLIGPRSAWSDERSAALRSSAAIAALTLSSGDDRGEEPRVVRDHAADTRVAHPVDQRAVVDRPGVELAGALADGRDQRGVDELVVRHHGVEPALLEPGPDGAQAEAVADREADADA